MRALKNKIIFLYNYVDLFSFHFFKKVEQKPQTEKFQIITL